MVDSKKIYYEIFIKENFNTKQIMIEVLMTIGFFFALKFSFRKLYKKFLIFFKWAIFCHPVFYIKVELLLLLLLLTRVRNKQSHNHLITIFFNSIF